jgi:hypothetical protein
MSGSEDLRKSVSDRLPLQDEIFLQPIDQNYSEWEQKNHDNEIGEFFEDYALKAELKELISRLEESEVSTDNESFWTEDTSAKSSPKKSNLHFSTCLKENWRRSLEETVLTQKSLLVYLTSPQMVMTHNINRTRAYSYNQPSSSLENGYFSYGLKNQSNFNFSHCSQLDSSNTIKKAYNASYNGSLNGSYNGSFNAVNSVNSSVLHNFLKEFN